MSMGNAPEALPSGSSSMISASTGVYHPQPPPSDTSQEGQVQRFVRESVSSPQLRPASASHTRTGSQSRGMVSGVPGMSLSVPATSMPSFSSQSDHNQFRAQLPLRPPQDRRLSAVHVAPSYHTSPTMAAGAAMQPPKQVPMSPGGSFQGQRQGYAEQDQPQTQTQQQQQQQSPQLQAQQPPFPYGPFRQMSRSSNPMMQPPAQPLASPGSGTPSAPLPHMYQQHMRTGSGSQRPTSSSSASSSSRQTPHQQHMMGVGQVSPRTSSPYPPNSMQQTQITMPMQTQMGMHVHSEAQQQLTSPVPAARQVPHTLRRVGPSFGPGQALPQYIPPSGYGGATGLGMASDSLAAGNGSYGGNIAGEVGTEHQAQQHQQHQQQTSQHSHQPSEYNRMV